MKGDDLEMTRMALLQSIVAKARNAEVSMLLAHYAADVISH